MTRTDLTTQVLAMKGADAVIDWAYPSPLAVQLSEFIQDGINIPTVDSAAAGIDVGTGLVKGAELKNLYATDYCNPLGSSASATAKKFVKAIHKAYPGYDPNANTADSYDAVYVAVAAAKLAKSSNPVKIAQALRSVTWGPGACEPSYHSDAENLLNHNITAVSFAAGHETTVTVEHEPNLSSVPTP